MEKRTVNKKLLIAIIGGIAIVVLVIVLIVNLTANKPLTCTRDKSVADFKIKDELIVEVKDDKIDKLDLTKSVTVGDTYNRFDQYDETVKSQLENAYNYLDKSQYKIKQKKHVTTVTVSLEKNGLILDNFTIIANNPDNELDVMFNTVNNLESASTVYKVGDKYEKKDLEKKIEDLGFKCE